LFARTTNAKTYLAQTSEEIQSAGGPRDGKGGAVADAICAAAMGCRACDKSEGLSKVVPRRADGSAANMHMAQSGIVWCWLSGLSSALGTNFIAPPVVHTNSMALGDTTGEAAASPIEKTNHTSMKRAIILACLSSCMLAF